MPSNSTEYQREYMRQYRLKKKGLSTEGKRDKGERHNIEEKSRTSEKNEVHSKENQMSRDAKHVRSLDSRRSRKNLNPPKGTPARSKRQTALYEYSDMVFLMELWRKLETKRLVSKDVRVKLRDIILRLNEIKI